MLWRWSWTLQTALRVPEASNSSPWMTIRLLRKLMCLLRRMKRTNRCNRRKFKKIMKTHKSNNNSRSWNSSQRRPIPNKIRYRRMKRDKKEKFQRSKNKNSDLYILFCPQINNK